MLFSLGLFDIKMQIQVTVTSENCMWFPVISIQLAAIQTGVIFSQSRRLQTKLSSYRKLLA